MVTDMEGSIQAVTENFYKILNIPKTTISSLELTMLNITFFIPNTFELEKKA